MAAKGFIFYRSFYEAIKALPGEQAKAVLIAISEYALDDIIPDTSDPVVTMAFTLIKPQIDANNSRKESGKKGAEKRWGNDSKPMASDSKAIANDSKAMASDSNPMPKDKDKDKVKDKVKDKPKEKEKEKLKDKENIKAYCAEPLRDSAPPIITIPLNDGSEYEVTDKEFREWIKLYPAVDVLQELRKLRAWNEANVARRKTRRGIRAHIVNWLSREQDKPHTAPRQQNYNSNSNWFLEQIKKESNEQSGDNQGSGNFESGIPIVLPWAD